MRTSGILPNKFKIKLFTCMNTFKYHKVIIVKSILQLKTVKIIFYSSVTLLTLVSNSTYQRHIL